jgi:hypothetical protein
MEYKTIEWDREKLYEQIWTGISPRRPLICHLEGNHC